MRGAVSTAAAILAPYDAGRARAAAMAPENLMNERRETPRRSIAA
jgi:hypothetical protein